MCSPTPAVDSPLCYGTRHYPMTIVAYDIQWKTHLFRYSQSFYEGLRLILAWQIVLKVVIGLSWILAVGEVEK